MHGGLITIRKGLLEGLPFVLDCGCLDGVLNAMQALDLWPHDIGVGLHKNLLLLLGRLATDQICQRVPVPTERGRREQAAAVHVRGVVAAAHDGVFRALAAEGFDGTWSHGRGLGARNLDDALVGVAIFVGVAVPPGYVGVLPGQELAGFDGLLPGVTQGILAAPATVQGPAVTIGIPAICLRAPWPRRRPKPRQQPVLSQS